jgi:OOP family OmpA-OmpF porin
MKKKLIRQFSGILILAAFSTISVFAQDSSYAGTEKMQSTKLFANKKNMRTFSVGVNAGVLTPVAAIGGSNDFTKWQPTFGYGGYIKNQFTHNIAVQADFLRGTLKANNNKELGNGTVLQSPYASYKTELHWAGSLSGVVTFGNVNWFNERNAVIPYVSVGGGIASYNPVLRLEDKTTTVEYKHGESIKEFFVPVGAGLKVMVATGINIDMGYRMNFVDGDNLDGYRAGTQKDKFSYGFAGLEFAIGNSNTPQLMMVNPAAQLRQDLQDENNALSASLTESEQRTEQKLALIGNLQNELAQLKKDSDGDGVSDYFDKCASTAANEKVDGSGCALPKPEVVKEEPKVTITEEDRRIVNEAFHDLEFDFGKTTIRAKSYTTLDKVATLLVNKNFSLKLAGHTDNVGSESANMKLSKDRAEALKAYLVSKGANPSRIEATGYGETQPIASNKTAAGRQKNRRVEFTLY